jgi:hypothetical protein
MSSFSHLFKQDRGSYDHETMVAAMVLQVLKEEEDKAPRWGSVIGREVVPRDRVSGLVQLMKDYFVGRPVYNEDFFQHRFVSEL